MEITLEKIELVKDRTGVSYKEAKEALEKANGSVVDAIIEIEETIDEADQKKISSKSVQIVDSIKELVKRGNVSRIIIRKDEEVVLNLPVNVGIIGAIAAPVAMVAGVLVAFGTKCEIEVVKDDGSIIDVSEMTNEKIGDLIEKGSVIADSVKEKGEEVYSNIKIKTNEAINKVRVQDENEDDAYFEDGESDEPGDIEINVEEEKLFDEDEETEK
ncbi:MAG: DUF4342 domain-containing protein [Eubacteriales bacterium]